MLWRWYEYEHTLFLKYRISGNIPFFRMLEKPGKTNTWHLELSWFFETDETNNLFKDNFFHEFKTKSKNSKTPIF